MNNISKMPDAYRKDTSGNLYYIFRLLDLLVSDLKADLELINRARDINSAYGVNLDNLAKMVNVKRSHATDEQYRTKALAKIGASSTTSDCNSVIIAIAQMFGVNPSKIGIQEVNGGNGKETWIYVSIKGLTLDMIENSGYSMTELQSMIKSIIPAGVGSETLKYEGA